MAVQLRFSASSFVSGRRAILGLCSHGSVGIRVRRTMRAFGIIRQKHNGENR